MGRTCSESSESCPGGFCGTGRSEARYAYDAGYRSRAHPAYQRAGAGAWSSLGGGLPAIQGGVLVQTVVGVPSRFGNGLGAYLDRGATMRGQQGGALPGGLTAADWNRLTPEQRTLYIQAQIQGAQNATDRQSRLENLLVEAGRSGVSGITDSIRAAIEADVSRQRTAAEQATRRAELASELERAQIQANTQVELARIEANRPQVQTLAATTPQQPAASSGVPGWVLAAGAVVVVGGILVYVMSQQDARRSTPLYRLTSRAA